MEPLIGYRRQVHVDRQQFLLLVTAIAACSGRQQDREPVTPPVITTDVEPEGLPLVAEPEPSAKEPGPSEEGLPAANVAYSDSGMCRASNAIQPPSARGCNDNAGNPGDCKRVKLAGGCSSFPFICDKCESYKQHFKPRVAERAVSCTLALSGKQLGSGCDTYACGDEALKSACPDASAQAACHNIAKQCKTTLAECSQMLSGMNQAGRAAVATCAASGCSYGLWSCIEGM